MFFPTFDFNILLHRNIIVAMIIKKNNSYQEFTLQATLQPIVKATGTTENPAQENKQEAN